MRSRRDGRRRREVVDQKRKREAKRIRTIGFALGMSVLAYQTSKGVKFNPYLKTGTTEREKKR